jgi:hypothetical protein
LRHQLEHQYTLSGEKVDEPREVTGERMRGVKYVSVERRLAGDRRRRPVGDPLLDEERPSAIALDEEVVVAARRRLDADPAVDKRVAVEELAVEQQRDQLTRGQRLAAWSARFDLRPQLTAASATDGPGRLVRGREAPFRNGF